MDWGKAKPKNQTENLFDMIEEERRRQCRA